jgi:phosphotransferase system enzyme I (PtsP)
MLTKIFDKLSDVVETHVHGQVLDAACKAIAQEVGAKSCSVFLVQPSASGLHLRAGFGHLSLTDELKRAAQSIASEAFHRGDSARADAPPDWLLAVPMIQRARPLGAIVAYASGHPFSAEQDRTLLAIAAHMVGIVESTRFVEAVDNPAASDDYLGLHGRSSGAVVGELVLLGTPASPGIAIGTAVFRRAFPRELARRDVSSRSKESERQRVRDGFEKARNDIVKLQAAATGDLGEDHALIFGSHLMLLGDPILLARIEDGIERGKTAAGAIEAAIDELEGRLRGVRDPYIQERVEDLEDVCSRILGYVMISTSPSPLAAQVVLSPRVAPSLVMEIKARGAAGIVAEEGGTTSHGAVLARSLGVPAVTGIPQVMQSVLPGDEVIVDGTSGCVIVRPSPESLARYKHQAEEVDRRRTEFLRYRERPPETADGVRICLQANVALGVDIALAKENRAEGIGLYRTEFPFIVREGFPTRDEQVDIYRKAYEAFPDGKIAFRLLDMAGDKFVPGSGVGPSASAFHGYRSIRVLYDYPGLVRDQVQAFAIAAGDRPLRILIPMVASLDDVFRIKQLIEHAIHELSGTGVQRRPEIGIMIEVPAAVELAADLAAEVEFVAIGTNDLIQYTLVVDREDSRMSSPRDAYHPAILRMLRRTVLAVHSAGKKVSVCGEMAARPDLAAFLVAIGVDSLSVSPRAIPELKQALAGIHVKPLTLAASGIAACRTAMESENALRACLGGGAEPQANTFLAS